MKSNVRSMNKIDSWASYTISQRTQNIPLYPKNKILDIFQSNKQNRTIITDQKDSKIIDLSTNLNQKIKIQEQVQQNQEEIYMINCKKKLEEDKKHLQKFIKTKLPSGKRNANLDFSHIGKQIKQSKNMLKNKKFKKIQLTVDTLPKYNQTSSSFNQNKFEYQTESNRLNIVQIQSKIQLLDGLITQEERQQFQQKIKCKLKKFSKKYPVNDIFLKISNYYVSYEVLSTFLSIIYKDTSKISVKNQKRDLYLRIKKEMISFLANEQQSFEKIKQILQKEKERQSKTYSGQFYSKKNNINYYGLNQANQQKPLQKKIQELLEISKNTIKDALAQLNKFDVIAQIDLIFNKRVQEFNRFRFK